MKNWKRKLAVVWMLSFAANLYAWDSNGHKLIAEIAYENLQPNAKKTVMQMLQTSGPWYSHPLSFSSSAAWADWIRTSTLQYNTWHYINLPYCGIDKCVYRKVKAPNLVTAITLESRILQDKKAGAVEKGMALRFYLHWIGDIHQPMHTINYYSVHYPQGDAGGNLYLLQDSLYSNLHAFWDAGCGLWSQNIPLSRRQLQDLAKAWQAQYPQEVFAGALAQKDPLTWAEDSHALAVKYAYEVTPKHYLTVEAKKNAQIICQKQIVLAGYRLAQSLNAWYARP